jgi:hypothetical protein
MAAGFGLFSNTESFAGSEYEGSAVNGNSTARSVSPRNTSCGFWRGETLESTPTCVDKSLVHRSDCPAAACVIIVEEAIMKVDCKNSLPIAS